MVWVLTTFSSTHSLFLRASDLTREFCRVGNLGRNSFIYPFFQVLPNEEKKKKVPGLQIWEAKLSTAEIFFHFFHILYFWRMDFSWVDFSSRLHGSLEAFGGPIASQVCHLHGAGILQLCNPPLCTTRNTDTGYLVRIKFSCPVSGKQTLFSPQHGIISRIPTYLLLQHAQVPPARGPSAGTDTSFITT